MNNLNTSYQSTHYTVDEFKSPIKIGEVSTDADRLLRATQSTSWAYITAYNPLSVILTDEENQRRNTELEQLLTAYPYKKGIGIDPTGKWKGEASFFIPGISRYEAMDLAQRFGQKAFVYGELGQPATLVTALYTLGKRDIFSHQKTAFLCSQRCPAGTVLKSYDWAKQQRTQGNCIISGNHSQIEKDVVDILLKGQQPLIIVLARGMLQRWDKSILQAIEDERLLIISPFDTPTKRVSRKTAEIRNRTLIHLSDSITVGYVTPDGMLSRLLEGREYLGV